MVVLNLNLLQVPYRRLVPISSFVQLEITLHRTCSVLPQAPPSLFTVGSCFGTYRKAYLAVLCGKVFETHTTLFWCETCGALRCSVPHFPTRCWSLATSRCHSSPLTGTVKWDSEFQDYNFFCEMLFQKPRDI